MNKTPRQLTFDLKRAQAAAARASDPAAFRYTIEEQHGQVVLFQVSGDGRDITVRMAPAAEICAAVSGLCRNSEWGRGVSAREWNALLLALSRYPAYSTRLGQYAVEHALKDIRSRSHAA